MEVEETNTAYLDNPREMICISWSDFAHYYFYLACSGFDKRGFC